MRADLDAAVALDFGKLLPPLRRTEDDAQSVTKQIAMNTHPYTDDELAELKAVAKRVTNPSARWQEKPSVAPVHRQRNFKVVILATRVDMRFAIYQRENLADQADFSCGIRYCPLGAVPIVLARYNGASHIHGDIVHRPHIHSTTATAILAGRAPESEAIATDRYTTLEGALACLLEDYNVTGISTQRDQPRLFS